MFTNVWRKIIRPIFLLFVVLKYLTKEWTRTSQTDRISYIYIASLNPNEAVKSQPNPVIQFLQCSPYRFSYSAAAPLISPDSILWTSILNESVHNRVISIYWNQIALLLSLSFTQFNGLFIGTNCWGSFHLPTSTEQ